MHTRTHHLIVGLALRSPTCIAQLPTAPGQITETNTYLTGTVLRGGLATLWLAGQRYENLPSDKQDAFRQIFLNDAVVFRNAWPVLSGQTWIVPRTAWTHKRTGGWQGNTKHPGDGVRDALCALLDGSITDSMWDGWDAIEDRFASEDGGKWTGIPPHRRLISRTALNRTDDLSPHVRGVTVAGQLYSFEALEAGQTFATIITGPEHCLGALQELVTDADTIMTIGQGRSRGLGQVQIDLESESDTIEERDPYLLAEQARDFSDRAGVAAGWVYLPVTLESDSVLRDRYLLPCSSGDPRETLWRYLPPTTQFEMRLDHAFQRTHAIGGWDELRRLPRPVQLAVSQGSVWVYAVREADLSQAIAWWRQVEIQGIGERRSEGYGRVRLLHPFHTEDYVR